MNSGQLRLFVFLLIGLPTSLRAQAPIVAVFLMESQGSKLNADTTAGLTDYLATRLGENGRLQIIPRDELYKRLRVQKVKSHSQACDNNCQIEVGRELAAQYSVSSTVSKVGKNICLITANVFDLRKAATVRAASFRGSCDESDLVDGVETIAEKIERAMTGQPATKKDKPVAPKQPEIAKKQEQAEQKISSTLTDVSGVVLQKTKKLLWERGCSRATLVWEKAKKRCDELVLAGKSNWRLPTIVELRSLIRGCNGEDLCGNLSVPIDCEYCDEGKGPAEKGWYMQKGVWKNPEYPWFWSSTVLPGYPAYHYSIWYLGGFVGHYHNSEVYHSRCVHDLP